MDLITKKNNSGPYYQSMINLKDKYKDHINIKIGECLVDVWYTFLLTNRKSGRDFLKQPFEEISTFHISFCLKTKIVMDIILQSTWFFILIGLDKNKPALLVYLSYYVNIAYLSNENKKPSK